MEQPLIDAQQDYELLGSREQNDFTVLKFRRVLETCDDNDRVIKVSKCQGLVMMEVVNS